MFWNRTLDAPFKPETCSHPHHLAALFFQLFGKLFLCLLYLTFYQEISLTVWLQKITWAGPLTTIFSDPWPSLTWRVVVVSGPACIFVPPMLSLPNVAANISVVFLKLKTGRGTPLSDLLAMPHYTLWKPKSPNYPRPWIIQPLSTPLTSSPMALASLIPHKLPCFCGVSEHHVGTFPTEKTNCCLLLVTSSPDVTLTSRYLPNWSPNWKLQHFPRPYPPFFVLFPPMTPNIWQYYII